MRDYSKYKQCEFCGKYDIPDEDLKPLGRYRLDYSMQCDGIQTMGTDPYAEEINGDFTEYLQYQGERHDSAMDI